MTVDNTELIRSKLTFKDNGDTSYFVQIWKRRKENPEMDTGVIVIDSFYINSLESFDKKLPHIKELCEKNNARAYINMNELSHTKVTYEIVSLLMEGLKKNNSRVWIGVGNKACGKVHASEEKLWLIDLDGDDVAKADEIEKYVNSIPPFVDKETGEPITNKVYMRVPTKNGLHMLVRTFDKSKFNILFPNIDIHKDNPTILYVA